MKFSLFEQIYKDTGTTGEVSKKYGIGEETVKGIFAKRAHYQLMASLGTLHANHPPNHLSALYTQGTSLPELCKAHKLPPCIVMRILLKALHPQLNPTLVLRASDDGGNVIEDPRLNKDIEWALKEDMEHSPAMDLIRQQLGKAYEEKIRAWLLLNKIPFYEEAQERLKGVPKTPDFRLLLPIAVQLKNDSSENEGDDDKGRKDKWRVITWIESKAMFGDPKTDAAYHREQFRPYWNRFGPGLVIYWFDFVTEEEQEEEEGELIYKSSCLPKAMQVIE